MCKFKVIENKYIYDVEDNIGFIGANSLCSYLNELYEENKALSNLKNLCDDYNITLDDIYNIVEETIEKKS